MEFRAPIGAALPGFAAPKRPALRPFWDTRLRGRLVHQAAEGVIGVFRDPALGVDVPTAEFGRYLC